MARCVFLFAAFAMLASLSYSMYDPCQPLSPISRGDAFPLGLVLVPSISASYLANLTVSNGGICNTTFQNFLIANYNASLAIFNLRMDRLQVLKMPFPDIVFSMYMASHPQLSAVAFRGNVTSQPVYIASGNTSETNGAGFMVSTALLLRFDLGQLQYLQWYDMTCNECGGVRSELCIHSNQASVQACATPLTSCTCANSTSSNCSLADDVFDVCSTAINAAWLGTDSKSAVMRTGPQVQRLNAYSITSLFNQARDKFMELKDFVYSNVVSSWNDINQDALNQYTSFEGGLSQYARSSLPSPPPSSSPPPSPPVPSPIPQSPPPPPNSTS
ncbi:hypothetical protein Vafri_20178 [Volvox africanus]|uniref:Membrane-associated protein n=1 Tax=Volvox africanus TaxID=51714 RepID=A0A8J4BWE5_9CHLO|nr:hypothetical protein Vafri_20178 [Volvox africanus]